MAWCRLADSHNPNRSPEQCLQTQSYVIIRLKLVNFTTSSLAQTVNGTGRLGTQRSTGHCVSVSGRPAAQQATAWPDTRVRNVQQAIVWPDTRVHNGEQATAWPDTRVHNGKQPTVWQVPGYIASSKLLTSFSWNLLIAKILYSLSKCKSCRLSINNCAVLSMLVAEIKWKQMNFTCQNKLVFVFLSCLLSK